jgi:hypothetical protein
MRSLGKRAVWLLPFALTGCIFHRTQPAPDVSLAPSIEPSRPLEVTSLELPPAQSVIAAKPIYNMKEQAVPIREPVRHHRYVNKPVEVTEVAPSPTAVPAIGVISSGDPPNFRYQTEDSIAAIERGLNGINRSLNDSEQKTASQIREFVKQAKAALTSGDIDGAHTLAAKAKVLLDELTK